MRAGGTHNPSGKNQYLPSPPENEILPWVEYYSHLNFGDTRLAKNLKKHYDTTLYNMEPKTIQRFRKKHNITTTRQQGHSFESIAETVAEIRARFPTRGVEGIVQSLRLEYNMKVSNKLIRAYLQKTEPDEVRKRKAKRFKRNRFYSAGVNDVWGQDQHDKWRRFGLFLHNSIDPFTGYNNWMKVWWTNSNPRLITKFYLDACREMQAVPMTTQSDPGTENYGVANVQTMIRQILDPSLEGTMQHRFMREHNNVKNEANWSVFRKTFSVGFENLFEQGVNDELYNPDDPMERLVFLWLVIPWLQAELDGWVAHRNLVAPRANKHKIIPHGIPELIRHHPEDFNSKDFKVHVPPSVFDDMEAKYAPPDHEVFQLTPPPFNRKAQLYYQQIGEPVVSTLTLWDVYRQLLGCFKSNDYTISGDNELSAAIDGYIDNTARINNDRFELLANHEPMKPLAPPSKGVEETLCVAFSDEEDEEEDEEASQVATERKGKVDMSLFVLFSDEEDSDIV